jgi:hypothetical protein
MFYTQWFLALCAHILPNYTKGVKNKEEYTDNTILGVFGVLRT